VLPDVQVTDDAVSSLRTALLHYPRLRRDCPLPH
jgi:hypothetical protein